MITRQIAIFCSRVSAHGYDLVQAADGEEAIEVARKSLPDLILLDVMMPKLDGIEATRRLKADDLRQGRRRAAEPARAASRHSEWKLLDDPSLCFGSWPIARAAPLHQNKFSGWGD